MRLSIVVPLLNERAILDQLASHLCGWWRHRDCEVILVDGGSTDGSAELLRATGFQVLASPRGRARQMNAGAAAASGDILLFLHADTRLPNNAFDSVSAAIAGERVWGRFDVHIEGRSRWFPTIASLINLRSRISGIATGDQAIFVRRDIFNRLGGFPAQPLMEDIELSRRLLTVSRPACLRAKVATSGRRWQERGVLRTVLLMWRLRFSYWCGVSAEKLARQYE